MEVNPPDSAGARHVARMGAAAASLAAACTACGACYRVCPTVPQVPALTGADAANVMAGIRDILRDALANDAAVAFAAACCRSALCIEACPEKLDVAFLMRLANLRVRGAMGKARVATKDDPGWSARVKAFARLTMTEEEQEKWL